MGDDVTLGELKRWLNRLDSTVDKMSDRLRRVEVILFAVVSVATAIGAGVGSVVGQVFSP